jgi:hypothetical protein
MQSWSAPLPAYPLYAPLQRWAVPCAEDGASQADYDELSAHTATLPLPAGLRFVCDLEPSDYYEMHIGKYAEVPSRATNWHDWFNALAWLAWPRSKAALNARHRRAIERGELKRGPLRDAATLFDECGVLVPVADPTLADALTGMRWHELFVTNRAAWGTSIAAYTLGHALFEQGLEPFIGWCGKAWLMPVAADFFALPQEEQWARLDSELAATLADDHQMASPRALYPLPLLGIPGWSEANLDPAFYANTNYFRPSRRAG